MSDPIDEIFNGTPDGIDEDEAKEMAAGHQRRQEELEAMEQSMVEEEQPSSPTTTESQPKQETKPTATAEEPKKESKEENKIRDVAEQSFAFGTGALDFGVDVINQIPGVNAPKLPKFNNDVAQATREIFSIVGPTVGLTATGVGTIGAAAKASKLKLLADPFVKWLGTTTASAGIGAGVDYVSELSEDDNAAGMLKKNFPRTFGFIPDDIATLDGDSPDTKRMKNVVEGVGLGVFTDLVGGVSRLARALQGVDKSTKWIPESEKAKNWLKENVDEVSKIDFDKVKEAYVKTAVDFDSQMTQETADKFGVDINDFIDPEKSRARNAKDFDKYSEADKIKFAELYGEGVVEKSAAKRSDDLDSLGAYNFSKSQNLDEPTLGLHDLYGYEESGIRSADDLGIIGASVDQVRIAKNYDSSYGRIGSVMTEPSMKFALEGVEEYDAVLKGLRETLVEADSIGYRVSGRTITAKEVEDEGLRFAANLMEMDVDEMKRYISNFRPDKAGQQLDEVAGKGVRFAIKELMQEFASSEAVRTSAYVRGSLGGQVADMAQGARYSEGSAAVPRAQDQILDRLEFLMIENGKNAYQKGRGLRMQRLKEGAVSKKTTEQLRKEGADAMDQIMAESKQTINTLREIKEQRPEMLGPLMLAYEATDGSVKSIDALNNYVRQSTGVLRKAFIDGQPEIPSVVMRGFWSNVYNSTLSAFATPIKAAAANAALLVQRPVATLAGAMMTGDGYTLRRGFYQYQAALDTLQKGMKYMGETFRRSGIDPNYVGVAGRENQVLQNEKQLEVLNAFADAKAAEGEYGPKAMMAQIEEIQALADHPWLRFGTRAMQAFDGFTQAVIGNIEARGRAFDMVAQGKIDGDVMNDVAKKAYEQIWKLDEKGRAIISDEVVRRASGEIAMNLDNQANTALSAAINRVPALKPFLLFTKTPLNMMTFAFSHNPLGVFINQFNQYSLPFNKMPAQKVEQLLAGRGIPFDENAEIAYNAIRAEMKGRKAIGSIAVTGAVGLFVNDSITGNGQYDRQKQRLRRDADWKPRSIRTPGGQWVSYDNLGAISDWLAFTADIMDNYDTLGEGNVTQYLSAAGFVLSASITDKSMLAGIEPIYDILSGNPAAINRWASSFIPSATMPGASQMAELGRLISPNLRVVEENLFAMLANRTPLKATLPEQYDWIDGDKVMMPGNNIARLYNTYSPWKVNGKISEEKQFLMDIEYDARPSMKTDGRGVDLTLDEQAEVYRIMGKNKTFKQAVQRIMRSTDGKEFRRKFREFQKLNQQPRLEDFESIHLQLDRALSLAKEAAIYEIDQANGGAISTRRFDQENQRRQNRMGEIEEVLKYAR